MAPAPALYRVGVPREGGFVALGVLKFYRQLLCNVRLNNGVAHIAKETP